MTLQIDEFRITIYWVGLEIESIYRAWSKQYSWHSGLRVWLVMRKLWVLAPAKAPVVSLSKKLYLYCLVLV